MVAFLPVAALRVAVHQAAAVLPARAALRVAAFLPVAAPRVAVLQAVAVLQVRVALHVRVAIAR